MTNINGWACFFLVSLRLVIGWHFFIEGVYKIYTHRIGKTATNTPWSGEGFFREGYGPLAEPARKTLNIDAESLLQRFDWKPEVRQNDFKLEQSAHLERFAKHYSLSNEQLTRASEVKQPILDDTLDWLGWKKRTIVKSNVAWGVVERPMTTLDRVRNINAALAEINDIQNNMRPALGTEVEKARLRSLKAEVAKSIAELNAEYDDRVAAMHKALDSVLTDEQRKLGPVPTAIPTKPIVILDRITMWSMAALGLSLLLGLFSRIASFCLALFLLSVTLIAPALPFAPTPPGAIGHYVYINLYTIEMVALLVLVAIPTGRWFGLDALFSSICCRRKPALAESPRSIPVRLQR